MASTPTTYTAYVYERFGKVEEILKQAAVTTEPLPPSQVRIHVHSAALNPIDFKIPELYGSAFTNSSPSAENPYRIGFDIAGVVVEVGGDVTKFKVGDEVFAMVALRSFGTLAQYVSTEEQYVAHKPTTLDFDHAAAVPLASLTSYQALRTHGALHAGERVLILGGSSATGIFAIQYAKAIGADVFPFHVSCARHGGLLRKGEKNKLNVYFLMLCLTGCFCCTWNLNDLNPWTFTGCVLKEPHLRTS